MQLNRRFLYWGVFLVAIGGVLVVANFGGLDALPIADAMRLWPLVIIAIGTGIVLRRTRFSLAGGILAAAILGLFLGDGIALASRFAGDCVVEDAPATAAVQEGVFDGPTRISLSTECGSLVVTAAPGNTWRLDAGNPSGRAPVINASGRSLSIDGRGSGGWHRDDPGRDNWHLTLPAAPIDDLSIVVNAGEGRIALPGAQVGHLDVTTNVGRTSVDLSGASVTSLSGTVNAGVAAFILPSTADIVGSLKVEVGTLAFCVPQELGLRIHRTGALDELYVYGRHQSGANWESSNYASAPHHLDLTVAINLGNVKINPIGGCK